MTNQAVSLKLSLYLDLQSYFSELGTSIHCFNVLCKILLLSKLINKSIHSQNGHKNSQNNANQCSLMSHWTSVWYAIATLLLGNCRYQTSVPVNSFQWGSCRPSEPISYLEHCKPIERKIYDQSNITLCLATSWEPCVMQFPTDLLTLLCEELSCSSERGSKTWQKRVRAREMGVIYPP